MRLFNRSNKKVALTEAGKYFKKEVDQLLSKLDESKLLVKKINEGVSGKVRIGYISSTYHHHLVSVLKEMPSSFPFVKTSLYEVPTSRQIKALEEGKLDLGILRTPVHSEKLQVMSLFKDPFVVVMSNSYLFQKQDEMVEFIRQQPFIFFNQDYAPEYHRQLLEICQRMGFYPDVVHEANNVHSILRLVESGLGISIVPQSLKNFYNHLNLSFTDLPQCPLFTEVVIAYKKERLNPASEWFIEKFSPYFEFS